MGRFEETAPLLHIDPSDRPGPGRLISSGWSGGPQAPSLAVRLDEAAAALHPLGGVRLGLTLFGALIATMILSRPLALAWLAGGWAIEGWSWFASRPAARGGPVSRAARLNFAANYLMLNAWWLLLGGLFWCAGGVAGQASGAAVLLSLAGILTLLFYNVPTVFLLAGAAPALGALSVIALAQGQGWAVLAPIWMSLLMGLVFCAGRALETPSIQDAHRRLNRSLIQLEALAENVPDVITRLDLEGRCLYVSPAVRSVLGYAPEALLGVRLQAVIDPEQRQAVFARLLADPDQPQVVTAPARHKDGRWLWLQTSVKLVREAGAPAGIIGVSRDVTERVAADAALKAAKLEAESANRLKSEFLSNISHELRTPMNGVLGALHLLDREALSPEGRALLRSGEDSGLALSQLLNDVLDFSRLMVGDRTLAPEPTDVGDLVRAVTGALRGAAAAKGIELGCELCGPGAVDAAADDDGLRLELDPVPLRQALYALVSNAVKFTAAGAVRVRLEVADAGGALRRVRLEVADTGIGIPAEAQPRLFEQFTQAEGGATRRFGGAGLGLPMTRALVEMMGGEIGFTSRVGTGSTFWLAFDAPAAPQAAAAASLDGGMLDGVHILLVEDNATNRLVARTLLTRLGAAVEGAEDGVEGVEAAREGRHDLILMDIQMPRMDGVEATRAIRGLPGPASQVPIIALTANVMSHQKAEYLAAGVNGVVAKPISPLTLLTEIARLSEPEALLRAS